MRPLLVHTVKNQLAFTLDLNLLFFFFLGFVDFRGRVANLKWVLKT